MSCVPTNQKPWRGPPSSQKMDKLLISFLFFSLVARMRWQPASMHLSLIRQEAYKNWFLDYRSTQERDGVVERITSWKCSADQFYLVTSLPLSHSEARIVSNPVFGNITGSSHTQPDHKPRRSSQSFPTSKPLKPKSASFAKCRGVPPRAQISFLVGIP